MIGRVIAVLLVLGMIAPVAAQDLGETLGDEFAALLRERPDAFRAAAEAAILGHGRDGAIDAAGIETMISVRRAALRASQGRRLLVADLDNDGQVTRAEVGAVVPALSASQRPRLVALHRGADADGDGTVEATELRDFIRIHAEHGFDDDKAAEYRRVMLADLDGDGRVTLDEVDRVVEASRAGG
jgi:Ca2+-binding EF-hand superfamily protein